MAEPDLSMLAFQRLLCEHSQQTRHSGSCGKWPCAKCEIETRLQAILMHRNIAASLWLHGIKVHIPTCWIGWHCTLCPNVQAPGRVADLSPLSFFPVEPLIPREGFPRGYFWVSLRCQDNKVRECHQDEDPTHNHEDRWKHVILTTKPALRG